MATRAALPVPHMYKSSCLPVESGLAPRASQGNTATPQSSYRYIDDLSMSHRYRTRTGVPS